jgi:hypothetical protein
MTDGSDRILRAAALGFAGATGYSSVVAIREDLPGEPLGIRIPLSVSTGLLIGWGAGVAAPWPMPVVALVAAARTGRDGTARPALLCLGIGVAGIVGILIEPNTYNAKLWTPATRRAVIAHVASCASLVGTGIWRLRHSRKLAAR